MAENPFWERLDAFADAPALIDQTHGILDYKAIAEAARRFADDIGRERRLIFLEIDNHPAAMIAYLGCLIGRHPVYLYGAGDHDHLAPLIARYRPNLIITSGGTVDWLSRTEHALHPDLAVLLSTSGSTGSAKFVKLSATNLDSNARAIATYLNLGPGERAITLLKPHYSYGLSVLHSHLASGGSLVLNDAPIGEAAFWERFRATSATSFAGVPYSFETLARLDVRLSDFPDFHYATQAGGRLAPDLVRRFAREAAAAGGRFYVMYGQTEAAPRMAYLPPELAEHHPEAIGVAIPGGTLRLIDERGADITASGGPGEIVYRGPNVMMGYAETLTDLARDDTPSELRTGDLATRDRDGLFTIVGRAARFVKLFGKRLNLDEAEAHLKAAGRSAAVAGTDRGIVIALADDGHDPAPALAARFGLPPFAVTLRRFGEIPRLANGKTDYQTILQRPAAARPEPATRILSWAFVRQIGQEAAVLTGVARPRWETVGDIFHALVGPAEPHDSFASLNGDSMCFVQVSLALEDYLGALPPAWERMTIGDLERWRDGMV